MAEETHTDFEIAIERELHGALPAPEAAQLAEHLLGCATCRAYQRTALEMETNMEAIGNLFSQGVVWGRVRAALGDHIHEERTRFRLVLVIAAMGLAALFVGLPLFKHRQLSAQSLVLVTVAITGGLSIGWRRMRSVERMAKEVEPSGEALFTTLDRVNRRQIRDGVVALAISIVCGAFLIPGAFASHSASAWPLCALFVAAVANPARRLLRLRRERATLLRR